MPVSKSQLASLTWVLIYGGLLAVGVSVFVLRAGSGAEVLGWAMAAAGAVATGAGVVLVVVRARMEEPGAAKKGDGR